MPTNKNLPPIYRDGDEIVLGRGADAIRIKGKDLQVRDASTHVAGHYPDTYPWDTPHRHPEWDVRRNHACDLRFPPDNIPVAAIPAAIRELKRLAIGGWIVNAPVSEDLLEGAIVCWDTTMEMWVAALAGDLSTPTEPVEPEKPGCGCGCNCGTTLPPLPDTDLPPDVPSKPVAPVKLPCTDFDPRLDKAPSEAFQPAFMGVVIGGNGVQTHGVVRHPSFNFPARTPLYLSATDPGHVTEENTGVFVGTVLVPGVLLLNVYAQIFDNYLALVKDELRAKIECEMKQLTSLAENLAAAIEAGDAANADALEKLNEFITTRLQQLQSFLDTVNRQYEDLLKDLAGYNQRLNDLEGKLGEAEQSGGKGHVVNTIGGRDALKDAPEGTVVFVRDASDDPAVKSGPATYILVGQGADAYWANITSSIKLDGGDILGDIDVAALKNAIEKAHGHANKALLDSITSWGEKGVKIGDVIIINQDGTLPGGSDGGGGTTPPTGGIDPTTPIPVPDTDPSISTTLSEIAGDVNKLKGIKWVKLLDKMPTEAEFADATKDIPEGGLFGVPSEGGDSEAGNGGSGVGGEEFESLLARVVVLESSVGKISQVIQVEAPSEPEGEPETQSEDGGDEGQEPALVSELVVAAHQDASGVYGIGTARLYGHVRVISDPAAELAAGDVYAASTVQELLSGRGTLAWPNGEVPPIGRMLDDSSFLITQSGSFTLPAGKFTIEAVGGGGAGQTVSAAVVKSQGTNFKGGAASIPAVVPFAQNAPSEVSVAIGGSNGVTTFTAGETVITGSAGVAAGGGTGAGAAGSYPGGAKGSYFTNATTSGTGSSGGGGGSRFSRIVENVPVASAGSTPASFSSGYGVTAGKGGTGYGAGGGGGGYTHVAGDDQVRYGNGGAGAPGCLLITALV